MIKLVKKSLTNIDKQIKLKQGNIIEHDFSLRHTKLKIDRFQEAYPALSNDKYYRKTVTFDSY